MSEAFIELIQVMGGDLAIVNKMDGEITERDEKIILRLLRDRDRSTFDQSVMTWHIRCPIFVAREWHGSQNGSFNDVKDRFTLPSFYVPKTFRQLDPETGGKIDASDDINKEARALVDEFYDTAMRLYRYLGNPVEPTPHQHEHGVAAGLGIANEHARLVLPMGIFTEFKWTVNAGQLMKFLMLFNQALAPSEMRAYARIVEHIWSVQMPVTHAAFIKNGRIAP